MPIPQNAPAIDRRLLRDDVYHRLRDAIVDGTLAPGEQLRDIDLAGWLGVSRTPVREALLRLAEAGLVAAQPGRSTTVSSLSERAVHEARDVVAAMQQLAVRESVGNLTPDDLDAMRQANTRFRAAVDAGDIEAALLADDELHDVCVRVASNRALAAVLDQYTPVLRRAERLRFSSVAGAASADRHDDLIAALADRDGDRAAQIAATVWTTLPTTPPDAPQD
ncbi:GntR family transcriptional regulator [Promicromonospora thailandica]|uniref:DNA-binding transcriptional regulator, GntR family n=1 Tax=Promicromonospora thailandica TaxID=765201 RepID=A0A9X2GBC0_9MICO|nr:GntR family transcriptional regulator [Promicromonospora thailandica]MCP2266589.1 DNA-binding transcriptional regulator, GntR family [Promicromonospora thailandica]BFF17336.1 GntR family transcriptional regulator [Promicromonospora thailandica]